MARGPRNLRCNMRNFFPETNIAHVSSSVRVTVEANGKGAERGSNPGPIKGGRLFFFLLMMVLASGTTSLSAQTGNGESPANVAYEPLETGSPLFGESEGLEEVEGMQPAYLPIVDDPSDGQLFGTRGEGFSFTVGLSYLYDSNLNLVPEDEEGGSILSGDFGIHYRKGSPSARGHFLGADYDLQFFGYESSDRDDQRSDPIEQYFSGYYGVRGAKTTVRVDAGIADNNGNTIDQARLSRESLRAQSMSYDTTLSVDRELAQGSIEAGLYYRLNDFEEFGFNDLTEWGGDLAIYHTPTFMPKTSLGLGATAGTSEIQNGNSANHVAPSFRARHIVGSKTSLFGSVGSDFRSYEGENAIGDQATAIYNLGLNWNASSRISFQLTSFRSVSPSVTDNNEAFDTTGVRVSGQAELPSDFFVSIFYSYEHADYFATSTDSESSRIDDYQQFGATLGRNLRFTSWLAGNVSLFYNYNINDANRLEYDFTQQVTGVRLGFSF